MPITVTTLTHPPTPPQPGQTRPAFAAASYDFVDWWANTHADELDNFIDNINAAFVSIAALEASASMASSGASLSAGASATSASEASASASAALSSKNSAQTSADTATAKATIATDKATAAAASATAAAGYAASMLSPLWHKAGVSPIAVDPTFQWRPGQEDMPSIVSSARASSGSRVNEFGLIDYIAANLPRIDFDPVTGECLGLLTEGARTNYIAPTEQFDNTAWSKTSTSIVPNAAVAPDGTMTADKLVEDSTTNYHSLSYVPSLSASGFFTVSHFVRAGERTKFSLNLRSDGYVNGFTVIFDLSTGSSSGAANGTGSYTSSNIISFGNGWYRVVATGTIPSTTSVTSQLVMYNGAAASYTGDGTSGIYIWGAQLEAGTFPSSYIPSVQTFTSRASTAPYVGSDGLIKYAAINVARTHYNPENLSIAPKLLLEQAATNLTIYSEQFDVGSWGKYDVSVTANAAVSPDGTLTADFVGESVTTDQHHVWQVVGTCAVGDVYTFSVFVKYNGNPLVSLSAHGETHSVFDLSTGKVLSAGSNVCSITNYGNGWYRCAATFVKTNSTASFYVCGYSASPWYLGTSGYGFYAWGAQVESGRTLSSYIPTTTAAVTRAADVYTSASVTRAADNVTVQNTDYKYNKVQGTLYVEGDVIGLGSPVSYPTFATLYTKTGFFATGIFVRDPTTDTIFFKSQLNTDTQEQISGPVALAGTFYKMACAFAYNDFALSVGGVTSGTDSSGIVPITSYMVIGSFGHVKHIAYFPRRVSNTDMNVLTA